MYKYCIWEKLCVVRLCLHLHNYEYFRNSIAESYTQVVYIPHWIIGNSNYYCHKRWGIKDISQVIFMLLNSFHICDFNIKCNKPKTVLVIYTANQDKNRPMAGFRFWLWPTNASEKRCKKNGPWINGEEMNVTCRCHCCQHCCRYWSGRNCILIYECAVHTTLKALYLLREVSKMFYFNIMMR